MRWLGTRRGNRSSPCGPCVAPGRSRAGPLSYDRMTLQGLTWKVETAICVKLISLRLKAVVGLLLLSDVMPGLPALVHQAAGSAKLQMSLHPYSNQYQRLL